MTAANLIISGLVLDVGATIFFFVISIIMIVKSFSVSSVLDFDPPNTLIGILQRNTTLYLCAFVIPLFVLLALNIIILVFYVKSGNKKDKIEVKDLNNEQLEALKKELLNDISNKKEN